MFVLDLSAQGITAAGFTCVLYVLACSQPSNVRLNRVAWDIVHFAVDRTVQLPLQGEEEARTKAEEVEACRVSGIQDKLSWLRSGC